MLPLPLALLVLGAHVPEVLDGVVNQLGFAGPLESQRDDALVDAEFRLFELGHCAVDDGVDVGFLVAGELVKGLGVRRVQSPLQLLEVAVLDFLRMRHPLHVLWLFRAGPVGDVFVRVDVDEHGATESVVQVQEIPRHKGVHDLGRVHQLQAVQRPSVLQLVRRQVRPVVDGVRTAPLDRVFVRDLI